MKRSFLALTCLSLACARTPDTSSVQQTGSTNDPVTVRSAIDAQLARFTDAMMKGDTVTMHSVYTEDAMILPPNAKIIRNRAEHSAYDKAMFSAVTIPSAKITSTDVIVTGDYAIETGTYTMTMKPRTGKAISDTGKYVAVWRKQADGTWKMIRDIFNSDLSAGQ